jgi:iron complex outermembrane receptor protein
LAINPALTLTLGASFDWRDLKKAEEYTITATTPGVLFQYPKANPSAFNWQGRLDWRAGDDASLHASISSRARFPTIFERFSTQFGNAASNPALKPERAINYEIGGSLRSGGFKAEGSLFYSDVRDAIVSVRPSNFPANTSQRRNLGDGKYYGGEIALTWNPLESLQLGANYTYTHRKFDIDVVNIFVPVFELTDVPKHKAFLYASWSPVQGLNVVPNVEIASGRTTLDTFVPGAAAGTVRYYKTGGYAVANLRVDYAVLENVELGVGARNLFDENYLLTDGFPEAGRSFFASLRVRY